MMIERKVNPETGAITDEVHLSPEENAALDEALRIIADRAAAENGSYDKEVTEYWLQGILNREGLPKMLDMARTTQFQRSKKQNVRAYC